MPYEFMLIRSRRFAGHGVGSTGTVKLPLFHGTMSCQPLSIIRLNMDAQPTSWIRSRELDIWNDSLIL